MKALRLLTAAAMVLGLGIVVLPGNAAAQTTVTTEAELRAAFGNPGTTEIVLGADIELRDCRAEGGPLRRSSTSRLTIRGGGHFIEQACTQRLLMGVQDGGAMSIDNATLTGGWGTLNGGAIFSEGYVEVTNTIFRRNRSDLRGAAIFARARVKVVDSTFVDNRAFDYDGGAIFSTENVEVIGSTFENNHARIGGAIFAGTYIEVNRSTFTGNTAQHSAGALRADGGSVELIASTVTGNHAERHGGGVSAHGNAFLGSATVVDNRAAQGANASITKGDRGVWANRSVIALPAGGGPNCSGARTRPEGTQGYSFSDDSSCLLTHETDKQNGGNPRLGELSDNGGSTHTRMPNETSPLVDAVPGEECAGLTDQRGVARPQGNGCDIGAVEREVEDQNSPPIANDQQVTTAQNTAVEITLTGSDPDGDELTFAVTQQPSHGELTGEAPELTYIPAAGYSGSDSFTFTVDDGRGAADTGTISITVTPEAAENSPPVAEDASVSATEARPVIVEITANDPDDDALTYTVGQGPAHGSIEGNGPEFSYSSNSGYSGTDSFTVDVCDPHQACDTATVTIDVAEFEPPPEAPSDADELTVERDTVTAGEQFTARGSAMQPGETVFLVLYSDPVRVGEATADDGGDFTAEVTIPEDTEPGEHTLAAYGHDTTLATSLTVLDDNDDPNSPNGSGGPKDGADDDVQVKRFVDYAPAPGENKLALTGVTGIQLLIGTGFALLLIGAAWLLVARRDRKS